MKNFISKMQFTNRDENLINFELETVLKAVFEAVQNLKLRSIGLSIMVLTAFFEEFAKITQKIDQELFSYK